MNNDALMNEWSAMTNLEAIKAKDLRSGNAGLGLINGAISGASSGAAFGGIGAAVGAGVGLLSSGIGSIIGANKAKKKANELNADIATANITRNNAFVNRANAIDTTMDQNIMASFYGDGGYIYGDESVNHKEKLPESVVKARYMNSRNSPEWYAKSSGRAEMTDSPIDMALLGSGAGYAGKASGYLGKYLGNKLKDEAASILASSLLGTARYGIPGTYWAKKGTEFLENNFATGGDLNNGVTLINEGGTHEQNPLQGVPMGMDAQGVPNLVEEGEVKFDDYIFSNRIVADDKSLGISGLPERYKGKTYADIAKKLQKESSERPNDPISKKGLEESMSRLTQAQEN